MPFDDALTGRIRECLDHRKGTLSEGGAVMMPPNNYGFSTKFTWVSDRFGVSWQLNLA